MMALYYKQAFRPFFDEFKTQKTAIKRPILDFLVIFTQEQMPGLLESLENNRQIVEFVEILKLVVFSHRYNKNDPFLTAPAIPFHVIRDPMYRYSRATLERFFTEPVLSFLFAWFAGRAG